MEHPHITSRNTNKMGFAALYLLTIVSFSLFALMLTAQVSSIESRDTFMNQALSLEQEYALLSCDDLTKFATQKGDAGDVDCYSFFLSSFSSLKSLTP